MCGMGRAHPLHSLTSPVQGSVGGLHKWWIAALEGLAELNRVNLTMRIGRGSERQKGNGPADFKIRPGEKRDQVISNIEVVV